MDKSERAMHESDGGPARSLALLWGLRQRASRRTRSDLSVPKIVTTAIELADADGLAGVSMRRIADRLGVGTMTLYTYVPGKAELVDLMVDSCYGETVRPDEQPGRTWRHRLEAVARANWLIYRRHRWILHVPTVRPILGPNAVAKYEHELTAVVGIGLTEVEMDLVVNLVTGHVEGVARRALAASQVEQSTGMTDEQWWELSGPLLRSFVEETRFSMASMVGSTAGQAYGGAHAPERAFEFGLDRILDGIEVFLRRKANQLDGQWSIR
jgi:AcrR family transcriptional regulator